jgi:hypothetical protein
MNVLILYTNLFVFSEALSVVAPGDNVYFMINEEYVPKERCPKAIKDVQDIFHVHLLGKCENMHFSKIIASSYITDFVRELLSDIFYDELVLVEDGTYDYTGKIPEYTELTSQSLLYLNMPGKCTISGYYKKVRKLNMKAQIRQIEEYFDLQAYDSKCPVVFTIPLLELPVTDTNAFLRKFYDVISKYPVVYLKQHPRDTYNYGMSNIIVLPSEIPGQIIDRFFQGQKIYFQKDTVYALSPDISKAIVLA